MNLFNGNLHLGPRIDQLVKWGNRWNVKFPENLINIITTPVQFSFNSGWLSGFMDAEGCFNIYIPKNSVFTILTRFILDQKDGELLFKELRSILGSGSIYSRKNNNIRYAASNLTSLGLIINYLRRFGLKTKKHMAYLKWIEIYYIVLRKEHKNPERFAEIKVLSGEINKDND